MDFFRLGLKLQNFPITKAERDLIEVRENLSDEFQDFRKWEIFNFHKKNNPFYQEFCQSDSIKKWIDIPIIKKKHIQRPVEELLSSGYTKSTVYINNTSGSTGQPFFFAKDKYAHAMTWALIFDRFAQYGIEYGKSKQARFYGLPLSGLGFWKEKLKDTLSNRVRFSVFDLSDEVLERYLKVFQKTKFDYINGYASSLVLFAKYLIKKNLVLKNESPRLKVCFTTSEMCSDDDRVIMEKGFGVKVVNEYGAAELDLLAFEDLEGDWIISNENIFLEILDDEDKPLPPGEEGRIIITALHNKAMPFIRYELGDIGVVSATKKGVFQVLQKLVGRTNDIAQLPSGKKVPGLTFYYISKRLLEEGGFMKEFIIKQIANDAFHFEYIADREINNEELQSVQRAMDQYMEPGLKLSFERKTFIDRTKAGKLKHFQKIN
jgi:phenylacetate-CoA ligase